MISVAHSVRGGTWQPARFTILKIFLSLRFLCRNAGETAYRFKVSLLAIYNHEICNQLASYGECCTVGIPLLPCVFIYQSQIGIPPWGQLGRFDEHPLDMFVSLLRNRSTGYFIGGSFFVSAKPAVTDGLSDRSKT